MHAHALHAWAKNHNAGRLKINCLGRLGRPLRRKVPLDGRLGVTAPVDSSRRLSDLELAGLDPRVPSPWHSRL